LSTAPWQPRHRARLVDARHDNGSAFTSRGVRSSLAEHGITHRRGGYRDAESQAFIESWFGKLKERVVWPTEFKTLEQA
jgi:putative transposase